MTTHKNFVIRLTEEDRAWLDRHGRPAAAQWRDDMRLLRALEEYASTHGDVELAPGINQVKAMLGIVDDN